MKKVVIRALIIGLLGQQTAASAEQTHGAAPVIHRLVSAPKSLKQESINLRYIPSVEDQATFEKTSVATYGMNVYQSDHKDGTGMTVRGGCNELSKKGGLGVELAIKW